MPTKMRTAVLVVHGMGSQRPLETVRGVVDAVWFDHSAKPKKGDKRIWTHPESSGVDLDLTVMTTNAIPDTPDERSADFHELYWAHLMSETKAVAVLLWLFELGRKGPRFTTGLNALWYCVAIFLSLLMLSISLLTLNAIVWFSQITQVPQALVIAPYVMVLIGVCSGIFVTRRYDSPKLLALFKFALIVLCIPVLIIVAAGLTAWNFGIPTKDIMHAVDRVAVWSTDVLLPPGIALLAGYLLMRRWGVLTFMYAYLLSLCFLVAFLASVAIQTLLLGGSLGETYSKIVSILEQGLWPWSLTSKASMVCAWVIIGVYVIANAAFLQPFLGDAARYFRNSPANVAVRREIRKQAVDTLDMLHRLRIYDRIVVVAHSLGTAVAYDMLRAYYSRICDQIQIDDISPTDVFKEVDRGGLESDQMRAKGRIIVCMMAEKIGPRDKLIRSGSPPEAWLVTDFVTLGSPLTHARYLMCNGESFQELNDDFHRRLEEREFPTCPPTQASGDSDGWLAFTNPRTNKTTLHHGGLFALTRWTNLYFPMSQLLWGDAVGGPVGVEGTGRYRRDLFGSHIKDEAVWIHDKDKMDFFTHTAYWSLKRGNGRHAPHIKALRDAIDLRDKDKPVAKAAL
jgi:hypothetical protein